VLKIISLLNPIQCPQILDHIRFVLQVPYKDESCVIENFSQILPLGIISTTKFECKRKRKKLKGVFAHLTRRPGCALQVQVVCLRSMAHQRVGLLRCSGPSLSWIPAYAEIGRS
jgi:hypothetical protein